MSYAMRKSILMIIFLLGATIPGCIFTDTVEFDKCEDEDNCLIIAFEAKEEYKNTEENPQKLADAIQWLIENPQKRIEMGKAGRVFAIKEFPLEKIVQNHLDIYEELIQNLL